jgi:hypothetical protein
MRAQLNSEKGQLIVEAVLLMVILTGITVTLTRYFANEEVLKNLITGPWQSLSGMMQNGEWGPPSQTDAIHPANHSRHVVIVGEHVN